MKKVKKIFLVILILIISLSGVVLATEGKGDKAESVEDILQNTSPTVPENSEFIDAANIIIGAIQIICSVISVMIIIVLGIKYMLGSAEEKAEYKKMTIKYIIGAVMLFGLSNILGLLSDMMQQEVI